MEGKTSILLLIWRVVSNHLRFLPLLCGFQERGNAIRFTLFVLMKPLIHAIFGRSDWGRR
jgi:hypothetical protein